MKNVKNYCELVKKYVNGEDLGDYSIEELEKNSAFMSDVLKYTRDTKMYEMCSEELKMNHDFVKNIIITFKDNSDFIMKVADYYIDNTNDKTGMLDISIMMEKSLPDELAEKYFDYNTAIYTMKRVESELIAQMNPSSEKKSEYNYQYFFDQYRGWSNILSYFTECMLSEMFRDNLNMIGKTIKLICDNMTGIDLVNKINEFIVEYMKKHDELLSEEVIKNNNYTKNIWSRIEKWENQLNKSLDEQTRYKNMFDMVHEYMEIADSDLLETEILYYVAIDLGIYDKVKFYDQLECGDFDLSIDEEELYAMVSDEIKSSPKERTVRGIVKEIIIDQLYSENPKDLESIIKGYYEFMSRFQNGTDSESSSGKGKNPNNK